MDINLGRNAERRGARRRKNRIWKKLVSFLGCVVVFCTTYALILPAITMEREAFCGKQEHTHTQSCYTLQSVKEQVCTPESLGVHIHTAKCADGSCCYAGVIIHSHNAYCYDGEGKLICTLPQVGEHVHTQACYKTENRQAGQHTHTESCYTRQRGQLICALPESEGHTHTDSCKDPKQVLDCKLPETDEHQHGEGCYDAEGNLTCTQAAAQAHHHGESCYRAETVYTCGLTEARPHHHTDTCYQWENVLTCGKQEGAVYEAGTMKLICGKQAAKLHKHTAACFDASGKWICGQAEAVSHTHTDQCFREVEKLVLTCGLEEHTHDESCYPAEETEQTGEATTEQTMESATEPTQQETAAPGKLTANMHFTLSGARAGSGLRTQSSFALFEQRATPDLADYITGVTVMHKNPSAPNAQWIPLNNGDVVPDGDLVRFTISYTLTGGALGTQDSKSGRVLYKLPLTSTQASSGTVQNAEGTAVGSYTIDTNSLITIDFYDEYVNQNVAGSQILGSISFDSTATKDSMSDGKTGDVNLPFTSDKNVSFTIQETIRGDLTVNKEAVAGPDADGLITYKIIVNSLNGTANNAVKLSDVMKNVKYYGNLTVKDKNGNTVSVTQPAAGAESIEQTLPAMLPGDEYVITYTAKAEKPTQGTIQTVNTVTVESKEVDDDILMDSDVVTIPIAGMALEKVGTLNADKTEIAWRITVGEAGKNLSGWVLSDTFNGAPLQLPEGGWTGTKANGETVSIPSLPFTFPDGTVGPVTINYTTAAEAALGSGSAENTVNVTPPGENPVSETERVQIDDTFYNPLSKTAEELTTEEDGTAQIAWKLTIDTAKGTVNDWHLHDTLESGQYFTQEQKTELENAFAAAIREMFDLPADGDVSAYYQFNWSSSGSRTIGFNVDGLQSLPLGKTVTISYYSTGSVGDGNSIVDFVNKADLNWRVWTDAKISYVPNEIKIEKVGWFKDKEEAEDSSHPYAELNNGVIAWRVKLQLPGTVDGDITVLEHLPAEAELYELTMGNDAFGFQQPNNQGLASLTRDGITAAKQADGTLSILIPQDKAQERAGQTLIFTVTAKLKSLEEINKIGQPAQVTLANSVEARVNDETRGSDSHTQTITNQKPALTKNGEMQNGSQLHYTLRVNAGGLDLVPDSTTMTIKDQLEYWNDTNNDNNFNAVLLPDEIHVYKMDADGNPITDEPVAFTYTFGKETTFPYDTNQARTQCTLHFSIPDNQPLYITYIYRVTGKTNAATNFTNTANVEQLTSEDYGHKDSDTKWINFGESMASANVNHLKISKVDADNYEKLLKGAQFLLYKYDGSVYVLDRSFTVEEGTLTLTDLEFNTAYYLTEVQAPKGYLLDTTPHYFLLYSDGANCKDESGNVIYKKPDDFDPGAFTFGDATLLIANERDRSIKYALPQTGGAGTLGFTLGGGLLTACAAYLLVRKKRRREAAFTR